MKQSILLLAAAIAALTLGSTTARASLITYTETVTASGSLDGTSFSNAVVMLTLTGDSANISSAGGVFTLIAPASVFVEGLGSDSFTDTVQVASNQNADNAGFGDNTEGLAILFTHNAAFANYDLSAPFGPVTGASIFNGGDAFATAGGTLILDSLTGTSDFSAVAGAAPTPEPSSMLLLATIIAIAFWRVRSQAPLSFSSL